jgi:hypothetical protein
MLTLPEVLSEVVLTLPLVIVPDGAADDMAETGLAALPVNKFSLSEANIKLPTTTAPAIKAAKMLFVEVLRRSSSGCIGFMSGEAEDMDIWFSGVISVLLPSLYSSVMLIAASHLFLI